MKRSCRFFAFVFHIDSASHEISSVRSLDVCGTLLAGFTPECFQVHAGRHAGKHLAGTCRNKHDMGLNFIHAVALDNFQICMSMFHFSFRK